jgi:hypothetical protein
LAGTNLGAGQSEYDINDRNDKTEAIMRLMGRHSLAQLNGNEDEADWIAAELAAYGVA